MMSFGPIPGSSKTRVKSLPLVLIFLISGLSSVSQHLPRVIILATGGTIAGQGQTSTAAGYLPGKISVEELLKNIPSIKKIADVKGEQVASVGSYDMTVEIWIKLARRINEIFARNEADAVVITHGTDTQEETAYFLNLTVQSDKPVVLTGSMRPATALSTDGPRNLYDAIIVAIDSSSRGRGSLVCFNESIYDGKNVVKVNTTNVNAFASPNTGPIGQVYDSKVNYTSPGTKSPFPRFDISKLDKLPKVEIAYMYVGASASAMTGFINEGVDGIIIAGSGNGSFNKNILDGLNAAVKKGIQVVRSSRVVSGRVTRTNLVFDDDALGTIAGEDHNPQKSRILLMLALTTTKDSKEIQKIFRNQ